MNIDESEIGKLTESIWATVLGLEVEPGVRPATPVGPVDVLTGCVHITGAWQGALLLDCPVALVRLAAAIMFREELEAITKEQIHDTLGELTNITGGNLKGLLPSPSYLSLPAVADGTDYTLRVLDSRLLAQAAFRCRDFPFLVSVLERNAATSTYSTSWPISVSQNSR